MPMILDYATCTLFELRQEIELSHRGPEACLANAPSAATPKPTRIPIHRFDVMPASNAPTITTRNSRKSALSSMGVDSFLPCAPGRPQGEARATHREVYTRTLSSAMPKRPARSSCRWFEGLQDGSRSQPLGQLPIIRIC